MGVEVVGAEVEVGIGLDIGVEVGFELIVDAGFEIADDVGFELTPTADFEALGFAMAAEATFDLEALVPLRLTAATAAVAAADERVIRDSRVLDGASPELLSGRAAGTN